VSDSFSTERGTLREALDRWQMSLPDSGQLAQIEQYCALLWRENQSLNLTRHVTYDVFVARDLNDVLQVSALIPDGQTVLDIGSGGGVPGVLLAIIRPDLRITLCESMAKKARVLEKIVRELRLTCEVCHQRAEALLAHTKFDVAIARAVGPLWKICDWFQSRWQSLGRLLALKGSRWEEELNEAKGRPSFREVRIELVATYPMPGTESHARILSLSANRVPD
jgi:16S rRNA (guanine527-N7)-methyltransferase